MKAVKGKDFQSCLKAFNMTNLRPQKHTQTMGELD